MNKIFFLFLSYIIFPGHVFSADLPIQKDTRVQITENNSSKFSKRSGYLQVKYKGMTEYDFGTCTATFISKDTLITSAHCVYDVKKGYIESGTYVSEKMGLKKGNWNKEFISEIYVMTDYIRLESAKSKNKKIKLSDNPYPNGPEYDLALFKIKNVDYKRNPGDRKKTGWNSYYYLSEDFESIQKDNIVKWPVMMFSYPSDKNRATMWKQNDCYMQLATDLMYFHNCKNEKGASGSAILAEHPLYSPQYGLNRKLDESRESKDRVFILGVNSAMYSTGDSAATKLTKDRVKNIKAIVNSDFSSNWDRMFTKKILKSGAFYSETIINKCKEPIQVAVSYIDLNRKEKNIGYFRLEKGASMDNVIKTKKNHYYIWASTVKNPKRITSEDGYKRKVRNLNLNMEIRRFKGVEGDYSIDLYCDY